MDIFAASFAVHWLDVAVDRFCLLTYWSQFLDKAAAYCISI